jgi:predicted choloylglycine hydrolase
MTENIIPYLEVSGSPREIGFNIGRTFKQNIRNFLNKFSDFQKHKAVYSDKRNLIKEMLNVTKKLCPDILDEIQGISDGAGIDFNDIFIHNCMHMPHWENCSTSILKTRNDKIFIAHNEDAHPLLEKYAYYVYVKPDNTHCFFSHCYPGLVPGMSYGFNKSGIVQTCNSLPDPDKSIGIARLFVGRTIYDKAGTISEAISILNTMKPRTGGASYTLASMREKRVVNIETTGNEISVTDIGDRYFRANHYISNEFKHHPGASSNSICRQSRGNELLPLIHDPEQLKEMMWDDDIYMTMQDTDGEFQTNSTLIFEITEKNISMKQYSEKSTPYKSVEYVNLN